MSLLLRGGPTPESDKPPPAEPTDTAPDGPVDPCPECNCGHGTLGVEGLCDDSSYDIGPDCEEVCNGLDDNCDGETDEGVTTTYYRDADGDGHGDPAQGQSWCEPAEGYVEAGDDCDDADGSVFPGAEEVCDGTDQDCDGETDEGTATLTGYADADGDGYGNADDYGTGCEGDGSRVADASDCDDNDASVYPGAVERADGVDNDCDGTTDESAVVVVIGYQCQEYAASTWTAEQSAIHAYLADLGLGWDELIEDGTTSDDENQVLLYDLALFCKCGWEWKDYNQDMIDAFLAARSRGTATLLFDDDIAWKEYQVTGADTLTFLADASSNGSGSPTASFDTSSTHAAYLGPWGTPVEFTYNWDIDVTTTVGLGETTLGTHSGGYPWWVVWEDPVTGVRASTMVTGLSAANEGNVGADAEVQLEIVFKNTATWLLDL